MSSFGDLTKDHAGKYATGDEIYLADLFLAPQIISLKVRFNFDMSDYPLLSRTCEAYKQYLPFKRPCQKTSQIFHQLKEKSKGTILKSYWKLIVKN
ncbi:putative glutathione transferase [Helianthus annuus]|nr:putative glutathione transferase [Helianthus annuus]